MSRKSELCEKLMSRINSCHITKIHYLMVFITIKLHSMTFLNNFTKYFRSNTKYVFLFNFTQFYQVMFDVNWLTNQTGNEYLDITLDNTNSNISQNTPIMTINEFKNKLKIRNHKR